MEYEVSFGREKKKADTAIVDKDLPIVPYIIVELKKPKLKDGKDQLRSYCNATGSPIAVWTNGDQISHYHRKDPNYFEDITDIPNANQTLADVLNIRFTLADLVKKDKLVTEKKSLKTLIREDVALFCRDSSTPLQTPIVWRQIATFLSRSSVCWCVQTPRLKTFRSQIIAS